MSRGTTISISLTINASGTPVVKQTSAEYSLPGLPPGSKWSCQWSLTSLTGGSSPTVQPTLEVTNDDINWVDLSNIHPISGVGVQGSNGSGFFQDASSEYENLETFSKIRLAGYPGGTAVADAWNLTATLRITPA